MEIKKHVILRTVADENMLIPVGDTVYQYNGIFSLTESGKILWQLITEGAEKEELIASLVKKYEIDRKTAEEDVETFLNKLKEYGII